MHEGAGVRPLLLCARGVAANSIVIPGAGIRFIVGAGSIGYISPMVSKARRIILCDHARLPWRFFGRLTAVQAGL
jgi:hypothetical protein